MADGTQIKKGRKFEQVLEGARTIFLAAGFEGASVDEIAKAAGVSKATLYSYFPDKRLLFIEVAKAEYERQALAAKAWLSDESSTREWLSQAGHAMIESFLSEFSRGVFRMAVSEADRFPELARGFYDSGPKLVQRHLVPFLETASATGDLKIEDKTLAADQFTELCKADLFPKFQLGIQRNFTAEEKARIVEAAVEMFLARYGT